MLKCFNTVQVCEASEFTEEDLPERKTGVILITQSGETADLIKILKWTDKRGIFTMGVCNVVGSTISRSTHCGLFCNAGREVAVAATKTFTSQIIALCLIAIWISNRRGRSDVLQQRIKYIECLHQLPTKVGKCLHDINGSVMKAICEKLKKEDSLFLLGKGFGNSIAK